MPRISSDPAAVIGMSVLPGSGAASSQSSSKDGQPVFDGLVVSTRCGPPTEMVRARTFRLIVMLMWIRNPGGEKAAAGALNVLMTGTVAMTPPATKPFLISDRRSKPASVTSLMSRSLQFGSHIAR